MLITKILFNVLNFFSFVVITNKNQQNIISTSIPENFDKVVYKNYSDIPYFTLNYIKNNFLILKNKDILWKKKIMSYSNNKAIQIRLNNERLSLMKHCFLNVLNNEYNKNKEKIKRKKDHFQTFDIYYSKELKSEIKGFVNGLSQIEHFYYYHWDYSSDYIQLIKGVIKMYNVGSFNLESDIDLTLEFDPINKTLGFSTDIESLYPYSYSTKENKEEIFKKLNNKISDLKCSFEGAILFKSKISKYFSDKFRVSFGELLDLNIYIRILCFKFRIVFTIKTKF